MPGNELIQSLQRGLDILRLLAEADGALRVVDVASRLGVKPPTAHNLLRTLASRGFVCQDGTSYRLGPAVFELATAEERRGLLERAAVAVGDLAATVPGATVTFSELLAGDVVVRLRGSPERAGILQRPRGRTLPLYTSASGLLTQAFASGDILRDLRARHPFWEQGVQAWQQPARLDAFLETVRAAGYAELPFGRDEALRVAVPVFDAGRAFVGILGLNVLATALEGASKRARAATVEAAIRAAADLSADDGAGEKETTRRRKSSHVEC